jgi:hypothetical protein
MYSKEYANLLTSVLEHRPSIYLNIGTRKEIAGVVFHKAMNGTGRAKRASSDRDRGISANLLVESD